MGHITLHLRPTFRINSESVLLLVSPNLELPTRLTFSRFSSSSSTSMRRSSHSSVMLIAEEFPKPAEEPCPLPRAPTESVRRSRSITTSMSRSEAPMLIEVSEIFSSGGMVYPIGRRRTCVKDISKRFRFGQWVKKGCTDASDRASCLNFRFCRFLKTIPGVLDKVFNNFENPLSVCKWMVSIQSTAVKVFITHPAGDASHFQDFQARARREHCAKGYWSYGRIVEVNTSQGRTRSCSFCGLYTDLGTSAVLVSDGRSAYLYITPYWSTRMRNCGRDDINDAKRVSEYWSNPIKQSSRRL